MVLPTGGGPFCALRCVRSLRAYCKAPHHHRHHHHLALPATRLVAHHHHIAGLLGTETVANADREWDSREVQLNTRVRPVRAVAASHEAVVLLCILVPAAWPAFAGASTWSPRCCSRARVLRPHVHMPMRFGEVCPSAKLQHIFNCTPGCTDANGVHLSSNIIIFL